MEFATKTIFSGKQAEEEVEVKEQPQTLKAVQQLGANVQSRYENGETCLLDILDTAGQEGLIDSLSVCFQFRDLC
jgi:hypothetical protein